MSDDGITWSSTVTALGQFLTTTGWYYGSSAATISTDHRLFVRFGFVGCQPPEVLERAARIAGATER